MEAQYANWKHAVEKLWSAPSPDWRAAARLIAEIAAAGQDETLRRAATQALPILRHAMAPRAPRATLYAARRRLSIVRDVLHSLAAPRFGRRGIVKQVAPDQHYRQILGLPLDRRLAATEIHQAFKQAAKRLHPDAGGDTQAFLELAAARDALMHPPSKRGE